MLRNLRYTLNTTTPDAPVPTIHYELTNHLGNVMAVITDEPAATETPAVESLADYYPFGMTMPGRSYNAHTLRHGFTGHEKESDLAEGIYTTEYRLYDARVGRWLSVDPLWEKNIDASPYSYCHGNPVKLIDPDGRVETYFDENGNQIGTGLNVADNSKFVIKEKFDKKILKKAKGRADLSTMTSAYKLPSDAVLEEALDVLDRTIQNGGTKEESSIVRKNGEVLKGEPGNDVTAESSIAMASLPDYDYPTSEVEATIHSPVLVTFNLNDEFAVKWSDANSVGPKDPETFSQYDCNIIVGKKGGLYKEINPNKSPSFERYIDNRPIGIGIFGRFTKAGDKSNVWLNYNAVEKIIKSGEK